MRALIVDEPWIGLILKGEKTWEMRKGIVKLRGQIGLIRKGSKHIVGVANVVDCRPEIVDRQAYAEAEPLHRISEPRQTAAFSDGWRTPWVLAETRPLLKAIPYEHRSGSVKWVILDSDVEARVKEHLRQT